jgi:cytidylate kinase
MNGIVLGVTGRIASGKSTIAKATAIALRCPHVSFGLYVRARAKEGGYEDRQSLQNLGRDLLHDRGAQQFCIDVLRWGAPEFVPGMDLVVEGIRHVEVADALRSIVYPSRFALVFLSVDERTRQNRFELRDGEDRGELRSADGHVTEKDVAGALRGLAALTLVSTRPSGELVRTIRKWVGEERLLWQEVERR